MCCVSCANTSTGRWQTRRRIGDDRFFDLHYADLMRDPIAVMRSLYDWAGDDLTNVDRTGDARLAATASAGSLRCCSRTRSTAPVSPGLISSRSSTTICPPSTSNWRDAMKAAVTNERARLRRCRRARPGSPGRRRAGHPGRRLRRLRVGHQGAAVRAAGHGHGPRTRRRGRRCRVDSTRIGSEG